MPDPTILNILSLPVSNGAKVVALWLAQQPLTYAELSEHTGHTTKTLRRLVRELRKYVQIIPYPELILSEKDEGKQ